MNRKQFIGTSVTALAALLLPKIVEAKVETKEEETFHPSKAGLKVSIYKDLPALVTAKTISAGMFALNDHLATKRQEFPKDLLFFNHIKVDTEEKDNMVVVTIEAEIMRISGEVIKLRDGVIKGSKWKKQAPPAYSVAPPIDSDK